MNKYQALKHNDGRMLAVVWPEEPKWHEFPATPDGSDYEIRGEQTDDFEKACEQAIANGIPFKEKEDIEEIKMALWKQSLTLKLFNEWDLLSMKPYPMPENIEIEINPVQCEGPCCEECQEHGCRGIQFAFIKKQQPERKEESQDELWIERIK